MAINNSNKSAYHNITFNTAAAFQPVISDYGANAKVQFNHGKIYDWNNKSGGKPAEFEVSGIGDIYDANGEFYIQISRKKETGSAIWKVTGASLYSASTPPDSLSDSGKIVFIHLCTLNAGSIDKMGARENIHHFQHLDEGDTFKLEIYGVTVSDSSDSGIIVTADTSPESEVWFVDGLAHATGQPVNFPEEGFTTITGHRVYETE